MQQTTNTSSSTSFEPTTLDEASKDHHQQQNDEEDPGLASILPNILQNIIGKTTPTTTPIVRPRPTRPRITYVDPFIGTGDQGHTYPGATVPFGMVQVSPDNDEQDWAHCSGYHYNSTTIIGFSHTHLSGTGISDGQDIALLPYITDNTTILHNMVGATTLDATEYLLKNFTHEEESASPGYYQVKLQNRVRVELTATARTGMQRYTYPADIVSLQNVTAGILLHTGHHPGMGSSSGYINITGMTRTTVQGLRVSRGWAQNHQVHFAMEFSRPFVEAELAEGGRFTNESHIYGTNTAAIFYFNLSGAETTEILIKTGLSSVSVEGAMEALRVEAPGWDFDDLKASAERSWEEELSKIEIDDDQDENNLKTFYTALYHTKLAPTIHSDLSGAYLGPDGTISEAKDYTYYSTFSIWDTFRAAQPLFTILDPDRVVEFLKTMLAHADAFGRLPVWSLYGGETFTMPGYHAAVFFAEAMQKGLLTNRQELERAFRGLNTSGMALDRGGPSMDTYGYIPLEFLRDSASTTLEMGYNDWCTARIGMALGNAEYGTDVARLMNRSEAYKRIFDPETGFMRAKDARGSFREPFDPLYSAHESGDYAEGTAWQHIWFVPQDIPGLIRLFGGPAQFEAKLDGLFTAPSEVRGGSASIDISGMIGQYAHGNEPSHHVAYLYNYAGVPSKTQARVKQILTTMYSSRKEGLSGNEDAGQMSAWYVLSALGFYPVNPAEARYQLGSPVFDAVAIDVGGGKKFEIIAQGAGSKGYVYVKSAMLNGEPLRRVYLEHAEIMAGGRLELEMSETPAAAIGPATSSAALPLPTLDESAD